jgi:hypothetical protein
MTSISLSSFPGDLTRVVIRTLRQNLSILNKKKILILSELTTTNFVAWPLCVNTSKFHIIQERLYFTSASKIIDDLLLFGIQCAQQLNFWPYVNVEVGKKENLTEMDISILLPAGDPVIPYVWCICRED